MSDANPLKDMTMASLRKILKDNKVDTTGMARKVMADMILEKGFDYSKIGENGTKTSSEPSKTSSSDKKDTKAAKSEEKSEKKSTKSEEKSEKKPTKSEEKSEKKPAKSEEKSEKKPAKSEEKSEKKPTKSEEKKVAGKNNNKEAAAAKPKNKPDSSNEEDGEKEKKGNPRFVSLRDVMAKTRNVNDKTTKKPVARRAIRVVLDKDDKFLGAYTNQKALKDDLKKHYPDVSFDKFESKKGHDGIHIVDFVNWE